MRGMELKVWVDGVQRIVCGVTEVTTCQEVVIALAQAIGETLNLNVKHILYIDPNRVLVTFACLKQNLIGE